MMRIRPKRVSATFVYGAALLLIAVSPTTVRGQTRSATTLPQYHEHVRLAIERLAALEGPGDAPGAVGEVRRLLPVTMQVEWRGETLEVHNEWLHAALEEYEGRAADVTPAGRVQLAAVVRRIVERLGALDQRLAEAEEGAAGARDKDAEKGRLASILSGPEFNKQASRGGALASLIEQIVQWIRELLPNFRPLRPGASPGISRAAQIFIFALALSVIAYLVWRHWRKHGVGRWKTVSIREARVVLGERLAPDETAADLLAAAEELARTGDLRGAIRKAYVALLCELGDRRVIRLAEHKTNRDYLQALRALAEPQLYQEMRPLTANFERHWYGFERASETDWASFRARCRQILGMR